jgi:hypothetical protein
MNETLTRTQLGRPGRSMPIKLLVALTIILTIVFLVPVIQSRTASLNQDSAEAAIEDRYGIHITMLAVTAGGGIVDFRFKIVDPEKANNYMHGSYEELPILLVENDGTRINPRPHTHHVNYEFGRTYYQFYRNPGGVVKTGSEVTAVLGDLQLRHIVVR